MDYDNYVVDDNGAWSTQSEALQWYRVTLERYRSTVGELLSEIEYLKERVA